MLPLPTPDKLLSDNYMLEGEMVSFKEGLKGWKMSEHSVGKNTQRLCWGKGAEGGKWLKKWESLEAEGLRSENNVFEENVMRYWRAKTWKSVWLRNTWKSSCKVSERG